MDDSDPADRYEMVDPKCFVTARNMDVDLVSGLPQNGFADRGSRKLTYENPVAYSSVDENTYDSPLSDGIRDEELRARYAPRKRARINEMYEGYNEQLTNAKIFEAIRNIDLNSPSSDEKKGQCHLSVFALFCLIVLCAMSLSSSGYIFYKVEIKKSAECNCRPVAQAPLGVHGVKNEKDTERTKNYSLSKQIEEIKDEIRSLGGKFNETEVARVEEILKNNMIQLSKINSSFDSRYHNWASSLEETNNTLFNQVAELAEVKKTLQKNMEQLSKINSSLNSGYYWYRTLNGMKSTLLNKTLAIAQNINMTTSVHEDQIRKRLDEIDRSTKNEMVKLRKNIAAKGSFRDCTLKNKTADDDLTNTDTVLVDLQTVANYKFFGITCDAKSQSDIAVGDQCRLTVHIPSDEPPEYMCSCKFTRSKAKNGTITCTMYYWQCPNT